MMKSKKLIVVFGLVLLAAIIAAIFIFDRKASAPVTANSAQPAAASKPAATTPVATFDKTQYSTDRASSIWVVVNKQRALNPIDYVPADLVAPNVPLRVPGNVSMQLSNIAAKPLELMFAAAKTDGVPLMLSSGYRPYTYQVSLYNNYVQTQGQTAADTISARPGHSEHQTGLAADIEPLSQKCDVEQCFADLPEGKWLAANAYKFGFIIRYPQGKNTITGYEYEPWHVRYVGTDLAAEMQKTGIQTLEEFFGLPPAPTY